MKLQRLQIVAFIALCLVAAVHAHTFARSSGKQRHDKTDGLWDAVLNMGKHMFWDGSSMRASGVCTSTLKISAKTGSLYGAGISFYRHHLIRLMLTNGKMIQKKILGPIYSGRMYTNEINLGHCVKQSDVEKVDLEAGGNDGWYINSITTYLKDGKGSYSVLTTDHKFNKWLDRNEHHLSLSMGDCLTSFELSAMTGDVQDAEVTHNDHEITLTLKDGNVLRGTLPRPIERDQNYTTVINFASANGCVKQSDIQLVDLVAGGNDGWYITSIVTRVKANDDYNLLTVDPKFNRWLDGNEADLYDYDATKIPLSIGIPDTPHCGYGIPVCECKSTANICIFNLEVDEIRTFVSYQKSPVGSGAGMFVRGAEGVIYNLEDDGERRPINVHEDRTCGKTFSLDKCTEPQFVDGKSYRLAIAVNGQVPGPTIIVHELQTVVMHIYNNLTVEGISVHWHGVHQIGTPWMDGVGQVSQCHQGPGSVFSYAYLAEPSGTFWYHSHSGLQRTDGLFGTMVVKERPARLQKITADLGLGTFLDLPGEHSLTLLDWMHEPALDTVSKLSAGVHFYPGAHGEVPTNASEEYQVTWSIEGIVVGPVPYFSGLINGKGRHSDIPYVKTRLSVFTVEQNKKYRFRLIGAQGLYAYKFSIDGHKLTVVNTDGYWTEPVKQVDFIILHTGERYDFILEANANFGNYWLRAETLETDILQPFEGRNAPFNSLGHVAEGILQYKHVGMVAPTIPSTQYETIKNNSPAINCTEINKCKAVNCPFKDYHESYHIKCVNVQDLRLLEPTPPCEMPEAYPSDSDSLKFVNFNFEGDSDTSSVNGRNFLLPPVPPQTQIADFEAQALQCDLDVNCNPSTIDCLCTQVIDIPYNKTVQFVLSSHGKVFAVHPIHLHGHTFHVVDVGYPEYNPENGTVVFNGGANTNIECLDTCPPGSPEGCSNQSCTRQQWRNGQSPNMTIDNKTIRKDTVIVPAGGYVAINIISNNPGFWIMHCHIEEHQIEGMAVVINEAFDEQQNLPPPPLSTNKCGNVHLSVGDAEADSLLNARPVCSEPPISMTSPSHYAVADQKGYFQKFLHFFSQENA